MAKTITIMALLKQHARRSQNIVEESKKTLTSKPLKSLTVKFSPFLCYLFSKALLNQSSCKEQMQ